MSRTGRRPLFSVVLTTHSRPDWLAQSIASVMRQTVGDAELIVVDDHSMPRATVPDDERIRVIAFRENRGVAAARNAGWDSARGQFVTFLDDDDLYAPDRLELAARGLAHAPIATCWTRYLDRRSGRGRMLEGDIRDVVLDRLTPPMGATAVRREVQVRFDERFDAVEDIDWWLRVSAHHTVATVGEVGYVVRRHTTARGRNSIHLRARENIALLDVHADYFAAHPKAAAFRLRRAGLLALKSGDRDLARTAFRRSMRLHRRPETLWHFVRSFGVLGEVEPPESSDDGRSAQR